MLFRRTTRKDIQVSSYFRELQVKQKCHVALAALIMTITLRLRTSTL